MQRRLLEVLKWPLMKNPCDCTRFCLDVSEENTLTLDQNSYLDTIRPTSSDAEWFEFASLRIRLSWLTHTRPDCVLEVSQIAQATKDMFERDITPFMKKFSKLVKHVHQNRI